MLAAAVLVALATLGAFGAWLGWDTEKTLGPDGSQTGPWEVWQVAGLAVTMIVIGIAGTWAGYGAITTLVASLALTYAWSAQAAAAEDSGLWPVGAALLLAGSLGGLGLLALIVRGVRPARAPEDLVG